MIRRQAQATGPGHQARRWRTCVVNGDGGQMGAGRTRTACSQYAVAVPPSRTGGSHYRRPVARAAGSRRRIARPVRTAIAIFRAVRAAPLKLYSIGSVTSKYGHSAPCVRPHWNGPGAADAVSAKRGVQSFRAARRVVLKPVGDAVGRISRTTAGVAGAHHPSDAVFAECLPRGWPSGCSLCRVTPSAQRATDQEHGAGEPVGPQEAREPRLIRAGRWRRAEFLPTAKGATAIAVDLSWRGR